MIQRHLQTFHLKSPEEMEQVVSYLIPLFREKNLLLLEGEVGSGKTELTLQLCRKKKMKTPASSPSFAIHLKYVNEEGECMDHVDLYRLQSEEDLESTGFWDLFQQPKGLVVIEWAQFINYEFLPLGWNMLKVKIDKCSNEKERLINIFQL